MLPKRQPHPDFMKTGGAEYGLNETLAQGFLERLLPSQTHSIVLRLGGLVILGVPGERAHLSFWRGHCAENEERADASVCCARMFPGTSVPHLRHSSKTGPCA